ncbi:hypothetical protein TNCV_3377811 [Trichonephila clavipes]|nr:hypothetical protein TNCV_3377811 [Trichonephila clavipes]
MAPYRRKKPAPTDYTTDEEDMIPYDVEEDELEQHPNLVQKDDRQYWKEITFSEIRPPQVGFETTTFGIEARRATHCTTGT